MARATTSPLYVTDDECARRVMGEGKTSDWKAASKVLERHGLPPVDPMFGGRYWPAVRAFLDARHGLRNVGDLTTDGGEVWS